MDHAPLTQKHRDFLARLETGPVEMSIAEQNAHGLSDLGFLEQAGYARGAQTYADPDVGKCRYTWSRTDKPIP